jgi:tetratricopeptide (TPR) repeat protein
MKIINFCLGIVVIVFLTWQTGSAEEKPTAQDWFQQGVTLETQGAHEEAIKMYTKAINLDRNYTEAYFKRGKASRTYNLTSPSGTMGDFNKVISLEPANAEAYYERGLLPAKERPSRRRKQPPPQKRKTLRSRPPRERR